MKGMVYENLEGAVTISRPRGTDDPEYAEITVCDGLSGVEFASVRIDLKGFAEALFGLGRVPCRFTLRPSKVGKVRETKYEIVPCDSYERRAHKQREIAKRVLAPFEIDGWKGDVSDLFNHHRRVGEDGQRVLFVRYVDPPTTNQTGGE